MEKSIYLKHEYQNYKNLLLWKALKWLWTYPYICVFTTRYAVIRYAVVVNALVRENAHCWKLTALQLLVKFLSWNYLYYMTKWLDYVLIKSLKYFYRYFIIHECLTLKHCLKYTIFRIYLGSYIFSCNIAPPPPLTTKPFTHIM